MFFIYAIRYNEKTNHNKNYFFLSKLSDMQIYICNNSYKGNVK